MSAITINGKTKQVNGILLLTDLLAKLKLNAPYLAVALNDKVIPRSERERIEVKDGDRIEIVHAVGGG